MKLLQLSHVNMKRVIIGRDDFIPLTPFGEEAKMTRGLLEDVVTEECKDTYKNDVVKVTIQVLYLGNND